MIETREDMKAFLLEELKEQHRKYDRGEANHYCYLHMLCNDLGVVEEV